jgi:hypothetical protein
MVMLWLVLFSFFVLSFSQRQGSAEKLNQPSDDAYRQARYH